MNGNPVISPARFSLFHPKLLIITLLVIIFILYSLIILKLGRTYEVSFSSLFIPTIKKDLVVSENRLPLKLNYLQNPILYEWHASVKGKVIRKNDHSFTLQEGGNEVTINYVDTYTVIYGIPSSKQYSLSDLPIGSYMQGIALLISPSKPNALWGEIGGERFTIEEPSGTDK